MVTANFYYAFKIVNLLFRDVISNLNFAKIKNGMKKYYIFNPNSF